MVVRRITSIWMKQAGVVVEIPVQEIDCATPFESVERFEKEGLL